jgi:hypothetical protein
MTGVGVVRGQRKSMEIVTFTPLASIPIHLNASSCSLESEKSAAGTGETFELHPEGRSSQPVPPLA